MERMIKADPVNHTGMSHAWDVTATNSISGASSPSNGQMSLRLDAGKITCSVCHDQHQSSTAAIAGQSAGTQQQSTVAQLTGSAAGKTVAYTSAATSAARGYILEIVEVGGATGVARFRLSNDGGVSWFGWNGTSWVAYSANGRVTAASVALNDGANVAVQFGGTFAIGDKFRFYVSYPFLRAATDAGTNAAGNKLCRDCHSSWVMDHTGARTWDGSLKSHPVGVALNANAGGYDRALPLDGNGAAQGSAGKDTNSTNDLRLAADGTVQCLTCHGVHHADGNSTTVDTP
jgi:cytochrome c553